MLPQCDFWRFCTTWMASSKGPISGLLVISASADVSVGQRYRVWRQVDALKTVNFSFTISISVSQYQYICISIFDQPLLNFKAQKKFKTHNVKVVQAITIHANHYSPATPKTNSKTKYDFKRENTTNNPFQDTTGNQAKNKSQTILTSLPLRKNWRPLCPAFLLHLVTFFSRAMSSLSLVEILTADVSFGQRCRVWRQEDALRTVHFSFPISIYLPNYTWSTFVKLCMLSSDIF